MQTNAACNFASTIQPVPPPHPQKNQATETSQNAILCNCFFPFVPKRLFADQSKPNQTGVNQTMLCYADAPRKGSIYNAGEENPITKN
jgi:hypothetical protein